MRWALLDDRVGVRVCVCPECLAGGVPASSELIDMETRRRGPRPRKGRGVVAYVERCVHVDFGTRTSARMSARWRWMVAHKSRVGVHSLL